MTSNPDATSFARVAPRNIGDPADSRLEALPTGRNSFVASPHAAILARWRRSTQATSTGHGAVRMTRSVWLPRTRSRRLSWPWVDITMRSALSVLAVWMI